MTAINSRQQLFAALRKLGTEITPELIKATYAVYTPLHEQAPKAAMTVEHDIAYGNDPSHRLDVFVPTPKPDKAPMIVYVHGGGFIGGERSPVRGLIYDNVPKFFARHGMIGINMTYRLAPRGKWPQAAEDVGAAVAWLRANAARLGGDPDKIVLMGQSAGSTHIATWGFDKSVHGANGPRVAGLMVLSSIFAPHDAEYYDELPAEKHRTAYFGEDATRWPAMNSVNHVSPGHPPVLICVAELDPYALQWSSAALLAAAVKCDKKMPWFIFNKGHNHVSPAMQIGSAYDDLGESLLEFVRDVTASR
jgi:triacylglycerol lipase